ncbi:NCS2 family permease, partial [Gammaproteobacteria bacterium]|nr:NCS2 family permease [Gammaproteobacteria bacterium]
MKLILERIFDLQENNTNIKQEFLAGFTTFITMAYIIFVNPQMMSASGMDHGASFVGTCIAAALACFVMGFYSNWPVALAPGMGLNAFFTYTVVGEMGYSWEVALGAVFLAGILFVIMSVTPLRRWMLDSIPLNLRIAMGSGVGLFIGFIGLKSGGIIVANEATFVSLGNFLQIETFLSAFGFLLISVLATRKISGAIIIGVLIVTLLGLLLNIVEYQGLVSYPPSVAPIFLKLDILGALDLAMISVIISFLFVNLFDTAGTLLGVAHRAKLVDQNGNIKNFDKAL